MIKRLANDDDDYTPMSDIITNVIKRNRLEKGLHAVRAEDAWESVMGPAISKYTTDIKLDRDRLLVRISSSTLRQELDYGKQKIIALLNEELGGDYIKKLILV